jgi:hypothetical protein
VEGVVVHRGEHARAIPPAGADENPRCACGGRARALRMAARYHPPMAHDGWRRGGAW